MAWVVSWWRETPWAEILATAKLELSKAQFQEWINRPETIERARGE